MSMQFVFLLAALCVFAGCSSLPSGAEPVREIHNQVYAEHEGKNLMADVFLPQSPGPHPAILLLHSGSWRHGSKSRMADVGRAFAREGFVAVAANYRLTNEARFPAQIHDTRDALRWMKENHERLEIQPNAVGILGYSSGGHLALLAGLTGNEHRSILADVQAIAVAGAPSNLETLVSNPAVYALLGGWKSDKPRAYSFASPVQYATPDDPPVLLMHGKYDMIVPESQSKAMAEKLASAGVQVEFRELPYGHMRTTLTYNGSEVAAAVRFFKETLQPAQAAVN